MDIKAIDIGARLKVARRSAGVTQQEAADAAGVKRTTVSNWEAGRNLPGLIQFRALLRMYGGTGYQILFGANPFELSRSEAQELSQLSKLASPELRSRIDMLLTILTTA